MICFAVYASNICLFDGSYAPSVPWQTSTCKHAAAQAWIQSCFYKIQLLQECNICQFQRAAHLHMQQTLEEKSSIHMLCYTQTYTPQTDLQCLVQQCFLTLSETGPSGNCFSMTTHKRPSSQDQHHKRYQLHYPGNYIFTT